MDELQREIERLRQENQELRDLLKQVTERLAAAEQTIKHLREQLGQNSQNSNWPSSRDKSRQKPKSLRPKTERKAGGQEGHEGHTLAFNPEPNERVAKIEGWGSDFGRSSQFLRLELCLWRHFA